MCRLRVVLLLIVAFFFFTPNPINADMATFIKKMGGPYSPTPQEIKMLPPACISKETKDPEEVKKWKQILGSSYLHLHHHCYALNFLNRIQRGVGDRKTLLQAALADFRYMDRIPEENVLRPEVEYNIGYVLYQLNRIPEAIARLRKAAILKTDYIQAYLILSLCYQRMGDATNAAAVLRTGLTKIPDSPALQRALKDINSPSTQ
jgi:tetratricopeptide (TPR) repeat protein